MSGVIKGIGKVFKAVFKVAKVVLPIALAVGAVVFTGGAALGVLPTFSAAIGGAVSALGIGGAAAGALTGAITSAGFGSAIGGLTSAAQGKSIIKGMQTGALTGAVTGGVLGAINPATFGIVRGPDGLWTTANTLRTGSAFGSAGSGVQLTRDAATGFYSRTPPVGPAGGGLAPGGTMTGSQVGQYNQHYTDPIRTLDPTTGAPTGPGGISPSVTGLNAGGAVQPSGSPNWTSPLGQSGPAPAAATTTTPVAQAAASTTVPAATAAAPAAAAAGGGGIGGFFSANPLIAGNLLTSLGGALGGSEAEDTIRARGEEERRMAEYAYGGVYTRDNPFGLSPYAAPPKRWVFNPRTNTVEEQPV